MHLSHLGAAATVGLFATSTFAAPTAEGTAPRVVQESVQRRHVANPLARDKARLARRSTKTVNLVLDNEETLYYANVTIGTPAQALRLHIDTGSSDLWVNTPDSSICSSRRQYCADAGTYSPNSSSTYRYVNSLFEIQYADGSGAVGDYVTDTVRLGGSTITAQQFAIGYKSNSEEGILGIGYPSNEAILTVGGTSSYPNVPQTMVSQGLINVAAYSLWLNDLDASTGSILFGGVNTEKYTGTLASLPVIQTSGVYSAFYIALTGIGLDSAGSIASNTRTPVLLDSGSSLTYLPTTVANTIFSQLSVTYDNSQGAAFIDCSRSTESHTLQFTFSGVTISVDMSELVLTIGTTSAGRNVCILGIAPAGSSNSVLGDTFLRSAYVVYDMANNQIALAQTNFNSTSDNIVEITAGSSTSSGIPDATGVANAVSSVATLASGGARLGSTGSTASSLGAAPTQAPVPVVYGGLAALAMGAAVLGL